MTIQDISRNIGGDTMKKICYVTTISGTLRPFVLGVAGYMKEQEHFDISFICDNDETFYNDITEGMHYYPVSMKRGISISGLLAVFKMIKIFKKEKFDLVQYSTPNASCYAAIAAWIAHIPVRLYCQWGIAYVSFRGIKRRIFKSIEKMVCSLSTWIEPDSFGNLNFSHEEKLYPTHKGSVIWNGSASGVNLQKFDISSKRCWRNEIRKKYRIHKNAFVFIFIGRVTRDKGVNELFQAMQLFLNEYENSYLLMVGNNENSESVSRELYNWSCEDSRIIYCGFTNVVEKYLAASDVYILPSYREGFGSAVVEAEAMGVPVIVSDIPGPTDAMEKDITGITVRKGDAVDLYNAMKYIYENEFIRKQMSKAAYTFASEKFEQKQFFEYVLEDRKKLLSIIDEEQV